MTAEVGGANPWHSRGKPVERTLTLTALAGGELPVEVDPSGHASLRSLGSACAKGDRCNVEGCSRTAINCVRPLPVSLVSRSNSSWLAELLREMSSLQGITTLEVGPTWSEGIGFNAVNR